LMALDVVALDVVSFDFSGTMMNSESFICDIYCTLSSHLVLILMLKLMLNLVYPSASLCDTGCYTLHKINLLHRMISVKYMHDEDLRDLQHLRKHRPGTKGCVFETQVQPARIMGQ